MKKYIENLHLISNPDLIVDQLLNKDNKNFKHLIFFNTHSYVETLKNTSEVIKRLPEFPEIMDKANQALTFLASGQIPQNSNSYTALNDKKSEMIAFRNQSIIGLLLLVIFGLIVF